MAIARKKPEGDFSRMPLDLLHAARHKSCHSSPTGGLAQVVVAGFCVEVIHGRGVKQPYQPGDEIDVGLQCRTSQSFVETKCGLRLTLSVEVAAAAAAAPFLPVDF